MHVWIIGFSFLFLKLMTIYSVMHEIWTNSHTVSERVLKLINESDLVGWKKISSKREYN